MHPTFTTGILIVLFACGCSSSPDEKPVAPLSPPAQTAPAPSAETIMRFEVFANMDSLGNQHGFGYDIYQNDKKMIHQTNIPGEPGIDGFVSEKEAAIIAQVVIDKLKAGGGLPTLSHTELIDYGITLKK